MITQHMIDTACAESGMQSSPSLADVVAFDTAILREDCAGYRVRGPRLWLVMYIQGGGTNGMDMPSIYAPVVPLLANRDKLFPAS